MNSLMPPIFPDNTEVNGKMKMKCLDVNGNYINEIVTGPVITYTSGERSFLKSISIDGYRVTVSYIDDLFQGATVECNLMRNDPTVIFVKLYPNGDVDIRSQSFGLPPSEAPYNSVDKSWKTISFNIDTNIRDGRIIRKNDSKSVSFDFIIPSPSEHSLYSSFITDMKYRSENNVEVTKVIDGNGKNDSVLLDVANNNKPCLIISNSPQISNFVVLSNEPGDIANRQFFVTNKMNDNLCTGCAYYKLNGKTLTLFCYINGELSVGTIANDTISKSTLGGCIKFKNKWILAWDLAPYLWFTESNVESPIGATFTGISNSPFTSTNIPQKLTYLDEEVAVCSCGNPETNVNIQNYSVCTDGTTWSEVKTPGISPFKLGNNYYAFGFNDGKIYRTTDKYNTLVPIGETGELNLWLISYANNRAFIHSLYSGRASYRNENVVVVDEDGGFTKTKIDGRVAGGFLFLNGKYLFLDSRSSDIFESEDGINNWTLNPEIQIPQTLGVEQIGSGDENKAASGESQGSWFIMTMSGANVYEYVSRSGNVTMVLNNSTTPLPVFYRMALPVNTRSLTSSLTRSLPDETSQEPYGFNEPLARRLKAQSAESRRLNDRIDELENKLRKFGIE